MVKLNVYTITYIKAQKEQRVDVIAPDPARACEDFQRWVSGNYYGEAEIVEVTKISKDAIYYQTSKRKKK